jgi:hypothetical protein
MASIQYWQDGRMSSGTPGEPPQNANVSGERLGSSEVLQSQSRIIQLIIIIPIEVSADCLLVVRGRTVHTAHLVPRSDDILPYRCQSTIPSNTATLPVSPRLQGFTTEIVYEELPHAHRTSIPRPRRCVDQANSRRGVSDAAKPWR